jgi:hypothetical protein
MQRLRPAPGIRELEMLKAAAQNLGGQAGQGPAEGRTAFQTVYDVAVLVTVVLSGALAGVLYKTLFPKPHEDQEMRSSERRGGMHER